MADLIAAEELLEQLADLNIHVEAAGEVLELVGPPAALPPDLADEIRRQKPAILATLRNRRSVAQAFPGGTAAADRHSLLAADVVAMRLDEFATARLRVEVTSDVLGERVVFASDNTKLDPGKQPVVYRAAELRELQGLSPDELRAVHRVKKLFAGTILPN